MPNVPKPKINILTLILIVQKSFLYPQKPQLIVFQLCCVKTLFHAFFRPFMAAEIVGTGTRACSSYRSRIKALVEAEGDYIK